MNTSRTQENLENQQNIKQIIENNNSEEDAHFSEPAKLVTFGSLIHLNVEEDFSLFLYSEGFRDTTVKMMKFDDSSSVDFSSCIFMILPFPNISKFNIQQKLIQELQEEIKLTSQHQKISERKQKIRDYKNKLDSELNFNILNIQRSNGSQILLVNSNFMLLHMNTMKYACLQMDQPENMQLELVEQPNKYCFFNFIPSLKLQLMRTDNFVYEEELFKIACAETTSGKHPQLVSDIIQEKQDQFQQKNKNDTQDKYNTEGYGNVYGSIDATKSWKLNLYQEPNLDPPQAESHQYLKCGDIIWILLSEKKYYLNASRSKDPFLNCMKMLKQQEELQKIGGQNQKKKPQKLIIQRGKTKVFQELKIPNWQTHIDPLTIKELQDELFTDFECQFQRVEGASDSDEMIQLFDLNPNGLWRIEPENIEQGGELRWHVYYRFRHLISGRYLCMEKDLDGQQNIFLSETKSRNCLFSFVPIDNLMDRFDSKSKIHKNAYFRIENISKNYVGFDIDNNDQSLDQFTQKPKDIYPIKSYHFLSDINTYRFRKASFQDSIEVYYLNSSFPVFIQLIQQYVKISQSLNKDIRRYQLFDSNYYSFLKTIKRLLDFLNNATLSQLSYDQKFKNPGPLRQNKIRESCVLGILVWCLTKIFPKPEAFDITQVDPNMDIIYSDPNSLIDPQEREDYFNQNIQQNENKKNKDKFQKQAEQHVKKRYVLAHGMYQVIKAACYRNPQNQEYIYQFFPQLVQHIGYGSFVTDIFQYCFMENKLLLQNLHQLEFPKDNSIQVLEATNLFSEEKTKQYESFLKSIVKKLKKFESYTKPDMLRLMSNFCILGDITVYINQEKLFQSFLQNRPIIFQCLLKVKYDDEKFILEKREKINDEYTYIPYTLEHFENKKKNTPLHVYWQEQLKFISSMCAERNYNSGKQFQEMFPKECLLKYIYHNKLTLQTKALFCQLFHNIYLDKEPRIIIQKPNLIRLIPEQKIKQEIVLEEGDEDDENILPFNFNIDKANLALKGQSDYLKRKMRSNKVFSAVTDQFQNFYDKPQEDDDEIIISFIKKNISEDRNILIEVRELIINILGKCYDYLTQNESIAPTAKLPKQYGRKIFKEKIEEEKTITELIFNNLTYEIIKIFKSMVKFGMFTSHVDLDSVFIMETIIQYLSFMLEYDEKYCNELQGQIPILKRSYIENQKDIGKQFGLQTFSNIGGQGVEQLKNLATAVLGIEFKEDEIDEQQDNLKRKLDQKQEQESLSFLRIYGSLLKLLQQYTNKTYTEEDLHITVEKSIEVKIKLEICQIFDYLQNWREDFYIDNFMTYFQDQFVPNHLDKTEEQIQKSLNEDTFCHFIPHIPLTIGQKYQLEEDMIFKKFRYYVQQPDVRSFDDILCRPFSEVLLIGFYFAEDFDLQNKLMKLIQRQYNQRKTFIENLNSISLVSQDSKDSSYQDMSKLLGRLKALHSYSQSWLQIIEQNNYSEEYEDNLDVTLEQLSLLRELLEKNQQEQELLKIKQKILLHLDGNEVILKFIEQGITILENNYRYFSASKRTKTENSNPLNNECPFSYKFNFTEKIYKIFSNCNIILSQFILFNQPNQNLMFEQYSHLLQNQNYLNIGQVELVVNIFKSNVNLCLRQESSEYLNYMVQLIKIHGFYPQFLELFKIFIINAKQIENNIEIPKKLISILLDEQKIEYINPNNVERIQQSVKNIPFYRDPYFTDPNPENIPYSEMFYQGLKSMYKNKFIEIIVETLQYDLGINWVTKAYNALDIENLLQVLYQETIQPQTQRLDNLKAKINTCDLLLMFFQKIEKASLDFKENQDIFIAIVEAEYTKMLETGQQHYDTLESNYIICHLLPLINTFSEHFLKDKVLVSILSVEATDEYINCIKIYDFAKYVIYNQEKFIDIKYFTNLDDRITERFKIIARLSQNFTISIPDAYVAVKQMVLNIERNNLDINKEEGQKYDEKYEQNYQNINFHTRDQIIDSLNSLGANYDKLKSAVTLIQIQKKQQKQKLEETQINQNTQNSRLSFQSGNNQKQFQKCWNIYKKFYNKSKIIKQILKEEPRSFIKNILEIDKFIENIDDAKDKEMILGKEDIITKFLNFIEFWKERKADKNIVFFILKQLKYLIFRSINCDKEEDEYSEELKNMQNLMDYLNVTETILKLYWRDTSQNKEYQYNLLKILTSLLDGGNIHLQQSIYSIFLQDSESEKFFKQLADNIQEEIQIVKKSNGNATSIGGGSKPLIESSLRVIQLFCEGHNTEMQDYMRYQRNSKVSYNMVSLMVQLLTSFKISNTTQNAIQQCLDTLTEVVQGPCKENQQVIANSNFLEWTVRILREEPKMFSFKNEIEIVEPEEIVNIQNQNKQSNKKKEKPIKNSKKNNDNDNNDDNDNNNNQNKNQQLLLKKNNSSKIQPIDQSQNNSPLKTSLKKLNLKNNKSSQQSSTNFLVQESLKNVQKNNNKQYQKNHLPLKNSQYYDDSSSQRHQLLSNQQTPSNIGTRANSPKNGNDQTPSQFVYNDPQCSYLVSQIKSAKQSKTHSRQISQDSNFLGTVKQSQMTSGLNTPFFQKVNKELKFSLDSPLKSPQKTINQKFPSLFGISESNNISEIGSASKNNEKTPFMEGESFYKVKQPEQLEELVGFDEDIQSDKIIENQIQNQEEPDNPDSDSNQAIKKRKQSIKQETRVVKKLNVHKGHIVRIKHKCIVTVLSLLELSENDPGIYNRIRRSIPVYILIKNLVYQFQLYQQLYNEKYTLSCFNHFDKNIDEEQEPQPQDEYLLEFGFNIFMTIMTLFGDSNKPPNDPEQLEIWEIIREYSEAQSSGEAKGMLGTLMDIGIQMLKSSYQGMKDAAAKAKELTLTDEEKAEILKKQEEEKKRKWKETRNKALQFFCTNTVQIEFVRKDNDEDELLSKCYFPLLPFCKVLPKEYKNAFHESIDIENPKSKLSTIMEESDDLIKVMEHEEICRLIFIRNCLLNIIASNKDLWENIAFLLNCVINLIIIFSYSEVMLPEDTKTTDSDYEDILQDTRMDEPRLFFVKEWDWTKSLINTLGFINLVLSGIVVAIFFIKRAPLLLKDMWVQWWNVKVYFFLKFLSFFVMVVRSVLKCLQNFDFLYYSIYMYICVIGLLYHPFFFGMLTVDFLRLKFLKNVVKAVIIPIDTLTLTFMVYLLTQYYFTIVGYMYFSDHYSEGNCNSLWKCFVTTFDYTYKGGGGSLGGMLNDPEAPEVKQPIYTQNGDEVILIEALNYNYLWRVIYDQLFLFIVAILLVAMVAGIIIDTFGALTEEQSNRDEYMSSNCFICDLDREKIEKAYGDIEDGFLYHIKKHHYLWNYVSFKAHLQYKDKTEFTGNESYITQQIKRTDVSWFPQEQAILIQDELDESQGNKQELLQQIEKKNKNLQDNLNTMYVKCQNVFDL